MNSNATFATLQFETKLEQIKPNAVFVLEDRQVITFGLSDELELRCFN